MLYFNFSAYFLFAFVTSITTDWYTLHDSMDKAWRHNFTCSEIGKIKSHLGKYYISAFIIFSSNNLDIINLTSL